MLMTNINTDIGIANTGLQSMVDIGNTMVNAANSTMQTLNSGGQTIAQTTAYSQLSSMLGILNLQAGDLMEVEFRTTGRTICVAGTIRNRSGFCFGLEFFALWIELEKTPAHC